MEQSGGWHSRRWVSHDALKFIDVLLRTIGDLLVSTGDDASIRTWKKAVHGKWTEYSEIETGA